MSLLEIDKLNVRIAGTDVLKDVSLTIAPGEIVALTGESGSGKSMTALSVMGLLPTPSTRSGNIILEGEALNELSEAEMCRVRGARVGMIFQEPMTALNPVQSIGDQVAETFRLHQGLDRRRALTRAAEVLTRVGLPQDDFPLTRFPHELSGGQRQRVVIALAIALKPALLIADEPTTALDVTTQAMILDLLRQLVREDGMGLMMITHDLAVVAGLADRIAVMQHGEIVETGVTKAVLATQSHPYTRALFAASTHQPDLPEANPGAPLLELSDVVRSYPLPRTAPWHKRARLRAVDGVSFTLKRGERLGLVGESGCGKSTLTRAILGLEDVQSGRITLQGEEVASANRAARRRMQVVFQDPFGSFNPRHKAERLVSEPLHLSPVPVSDRERRDRVIAMLEAVGLSATDAEKYPHQFSGGQRQRLAIARALIVEPDLVIFDEAVSALDVSVRAQILDLLADLCASRALTYLFISHDLSVVRGVSDNVLVMQAGQIVEAGPTQQVFAAPQHPYTKSLIAAAPRMPDLGRAGTREVS